MTYNTKSLRNLKPYKRGQSGNPHGRQLGSKNFSTMVKSVLEDPSMLDTAIKSHKSLSWLYDINSDNGIYAIITAIMIQALKGDVRAAAWLKNQGWGDVIETETPEERNITVVTFATKSDTL